MNKTAQVEIEAGPAIMAILGGIFAYVMAARMDMGIVVRIITGLLTTIVCYFIAWFIANQ